MHNFLVMERKGYVCKETILKTLVPLQSLIRLSCHSNYYSTKTNEQWYEAVSLNYAPYVDLWSKKDYVMGVLAKLLTKEGVDSLVIAQ